MRAMSAVSLMILCALVGGDAVADTMSLAEQQREAQRLKSLCSNDATYQRHLQQAQAGSMRASYEAAAAMLQCFYDNVDARYSPEQKQHWLEAIRENKAQATSLGR